MDKKYTANIVNRTARPRSERLRRLGIGGTSKTSIVQSGQYAGTTPSGETHSHPNLPYLNEISTDNDGYLYLSKTTTDEDGNDITVKSKVLSGCADDSKAWEGKKAIDYIDQPVRSEDNVEFASVSTECLSSKSFTTGTDGIGFRLINTDGVARLELDELFIRRKLKTVEYEIQQILHRGGIEYFTPAAIECTSVVEVDGVYRCFFDTKRGSIKNLFLVDDQARCIIRDGLVETKSYWRLVVAVGEDYIDLSMDDCLGSGIPAEGDRIVQLGSRSNRSRQAAAILSVVDDGGPYLYFYDEIDSYTLDGKRVVALGAVGGQVTIDVNRGKFSNVVIGSGSSGLENLAEWAAKQKSIDEANASANTALVEVEKVKSSLDAINSDAVLTDVEKRSLRLTMKSISECEKKIAKYDMCIQKGCPDNNQDDKDWQIVEKGQISNGNSQDAYIGWYSSDMHDHSSSTVSQLKINTIRECTLEIMFASDGESSFDYVVMSALDSDVDITKSEHSLTDSSLQANTKRAQNISMVKSYPLLPTGEDDFHRIYIAYKKDVSTSVGTDAGYYKINHSNLLIDDEGLICISNAKGTFHTCYFELMKRGKKQYAEVLTNKLDALFVYLDTYGLWEEGNTDIPADYIDNVSKLYGDYLNYAMICDMVLNDTKISDLDYLKSVFQDGKTEMNGGLVVANMVGVRDGENDAIAGALNGSDAIGFDENHGKLVFFAGPSDEGDDLDAKVRNSTYRIYADGASFGRNMTLEEGCTIGGFSVFKYNNEVIMGNKLSVTDTPETQMYFSCSGLEYATVYTNGLQYIVPEKVDISRRGVHVTKYCDDDSVDTTECFMANLRGAGIGYSVLGNAESIGFEAEVDGGVAFKATKGTFAGLRPLAVSTSSSYQVGDDEFTVISQSGSVTLPKSPQKGHIVRVIHTSTASLTVISTSIQIKYSSGTSYNVQSSAIEMLEFIYDSDLNKWYMFKHQ